MVLEALRVIESRCGDPKLCLNAVAREIAASRRSLQRAFESEGITFRQAVTVARLKAARKMFERGSPRVYVVAREVGYQSKAEFAKAFKRHTGTTPKDYRRAMRERRQREAEAHSLSGAAPAGRYASA